MPHALGLISHAGSHDGVITSVHYVLETPQSGIIHQSSGAWGLINIHRDVYSGHHDAIHIMVIINTGVSSYIPDHSTDSKRVLGVPTHHH